MVLSVAGRLTTVLPKGTTLRENDIVSKHDANVSQLMIPSRLVLTNANNNFAS